MDVGLAVDPRWMAGGRRPEHPARSAAARRHLFRARPPHQGLFPARDRRPLPLAVPRHAGPQHPQHHAAAQDRRDQLSAADALGIRRAAGAWHLGAAGAEIARPACAAGGGRRRPGRRRGLQRVGLRLWLAFLVSPLLLFPFRDPVLAAARAKASAEILELVDEIDDGIPRDLDGLRPRLGAHRAELGRQGRWCSPGCWG